ncbi:MAG TPA: S8 family peptidase, partial [Actinomycetota bacterium]|nr:S8 family peptidase [Actinomycetota bacterium]
PNIRRTLTDTRFDEQWAHQNTGQSHAIADPPSDSAAGSNDADADTLEAWATQDGDDPPTTDPPVIAIVDSGVDVSHLDLAPNLWTNPDETLNGADDDGNGLEDDLHGCDFTDSDCSDPQLVDPPSVTGYEHGTHVAGIAAAERGDALTPVVGACPECEIMVLKIGDERGLDLAAELRALAYARSEGADIVNMSFGGPFWSKLERDAIARLGTSGILAVVAAGNEALDNDIALANPFSGFSPSFPASYTLPNIVSVAASNHRDQWGYFTGCGSQTSAQCFFTNWGRRSVDLAAPGVDIVSTVPGQGSDVFNGTSMAAPFVAGVAGLVKAENPTYDARQLKAVLLNSAERPSGLSRLPLRGRLRSGSFSVTGNGRINANTALLPTVQATRAEEVHDGTITGAKKLRRERKGAVSWPGDANDVFRKRLRRGVYRVTLRTKRGVDFDLYVWKPKTVEIWQLEESCFPKRSACRLKAQRTTEKGDETIDGMRISKRGTYYFHVSAYLLEKGGYTLRIRRIGSL